MKNAYAVKLQQRKAAELHEATTEDFDFALNLCAVALNNIFGFGDERLTRLENEVTRILEEDFASDMEKASYGLKNRVKQIRRIS